MKSVFKFMVVVVLLAFCRGKDDQCLHSGCPLSAGIKSPELENAIHRQLKGKEMKENILKVMTWNIMNNTDNDGEDSWKNRKADVCKFITEVRPTVLGLQEVTTNRLQYLVKCLGGYQMITTKKRNKGLSPNPIFVKRNRRFRVMNAGIFQLPTKPNSTQTQSCSWIKLRFAERLKAPGRVKESFRDKMLRLLRQSTNNAKQRNRHIPKRRRFYVEYRWKDIFIANTQLDANQTGVAENQIVHVMKHMRQNKMQRRAYPVIIMGDFGHEQQTELHQAIKERKWIKNTMITSRKALPALTKINLKTLKEERLIDFIGSRKLTALLSAVLMDARPNGRPFSDHRPVLTAYVI
ncbi:uncharacterized protein LOC130614057 [Hydractinia symbiolongicarpus]|uniref:uncharacterized protein LOC130614057 n=1 Tax=Hydractinia symbiolongicarpus TaxID=13093 RepID=UPI00254E2A05|nr:uncharacterized protein LOC130614057 [Hydractinia symbiolongicarpus]